MQLFFALFRIALGCVAVSAAVGCATGPAKGCQDGLNTSECSDQCAGFKTCAECAAQPACGWCADAPGNEGSCVPALNGEDHRSERPDTCAQAWFYRPAKLSAPPGAPYCPPPSK